jgi:hypothetical protein
MMPPRRRCICQNEDPNSPLPPGSDGCDPSRPATAPTLADSLAVPAEVMTSAFQDSGTRVLKDPTTTDKETTS